MPGLALRCLDYNDWPNSGGSALGVHYDLRSSLFPLRRSIFNMIDLGGEETLRNRQGVPFQHCTPESKTRRSYAYGSFSRSCYTGDLSTSSQNTKLTSFTGTASASQVREGRLICQQKLHSFSAPGAARS